MNAATLVRPEAVLTERTHPTPRLASCIRCHGDQVPCEDVIGHWQGELPARHLPRSTKLEAPTLIRSDAVLTETSYPKYWLASCNCCQGDLVLCEDVIGHYRKCVNCGRTDGLPRGQ